MRTLEFMAEGDPILQTMERVRSRWERLAMRFYRIERAGEALRNTNTILTGEIKHLEAELLKLRPADTKWGWIWWTLMRPEVVSVRVLLGEGKDKHTIRNTIYAAMSMAWKHTRFDVKIHRVGDGLWDVSRGRTETVGGRDQGDDPGSVCLGCANEGKVNGGKCDH